MPRNWKRKGEFVSRRKSQRPRPSSSTSWPSPSVRELSKSLKKSKKRMHIVRGYCSNIVSHRLQYYENERGPSQGCTADKETPPSPAVCSKSVAGDEGQFASFKTITISQVSETCRFCTHSPTPSPFPDPSLSGDGVR